MQDRKRQTADEIHTSGMYFEPPKFIEIRSYMLIPFNLVYESDARIESPLQSKILLLSNISMNGAAIVKQAAPRMLSA